MAPASAPSPKFGQKPYYYRLNETHMYGTEEAPTDLTPIQNFTELSHDDKKLKRGQEGRQATN